MAATKDEKQALTEKRIARLPAPDPSGRQTIHWDTDLKGFAVLVSGVSKIKTYIAQKKLPSGSDRPPLGGPS